MKKHSHLINLRYFKRKLLENIFEKWKFLTSITKKHGQGILAQIIHDTSSIHGEKVGPLLVTENANEANDFHNDITAHDIPMIITLTIVCNVMGTVLDAVTNLMWS